MFGSISRSALACVALTLASAAIGVGADYNIGAGIADITGPIAEVNFMGYANLEQKGAGLRQRTYSRAFIVHDTTTNKRVVHVTTDTGMMSQFVRQRVLDNLEKKFGTGVYTRENVMITGTHSHSGPGGFLGYVLYDISILGWIEQTAQAITTGAGSITLSVGELLEASINRSPSSYEFNPAEERIGMLNWFATHGTSMNNTNLLVSGDNKGYAAIKFEQTMNPAESKTGLSNGFVAAFSQSNMGDVSPNIEGAKCLDTGLPCDYDRSTCNGKNELCVARGPGWRQGDFASNQIIGDRQYNKARELYDGTPQRTLSGPVDFRHIYLDISNAPFTYDNGTTGTTCKPAMGYAFAAGTTDGPGQFDFYQGQNSSNLFWNLVGSVVTKPPSKEQAKCHYPKPILFNTGEATTPFPWQPAIVELQVFRIGQLFIVGVPAEFTTMSGRRMRDAVKKAAIAQGIADENATIVISGPSNTYSSYTTTPEEYAVQRYEAGSTIYGPGTLPAYIQNAVQLVEAMANNTRVASAPAPPDFSSKFMTLQTDVVFDAVPIGKSFGDVSTNVKSSYTRGSTVQVIFWTGHPKNNLLLEETYISVERLDTTTNTWIRVRDDGYWSTRYKWDKVNGVGQNRAIIEWDIESDTILGTYRIRHFGHHRTLFQHVVAHTGTSATFQVIA
ncbi:Neutral/alkaline nonlysosomal ceramidase [Syncephalis plumigaleata]|nr:Neutral/alkaline nonlysosomal ceramidase [Syncephalis plumigaleata]